MHLENYKKPKRPCLFCKIEQSRLKRHILSQHKDEARVKPLIEKNLPEKEVNFAIEMFRNEAILNYNKEALKIGSKNVLRSRISLTSNDLPVYCTGCKGFFAKNYKSRHQKICPSTTGVAIMMPIISLPTAESLTENLPDDFKELLNSLHMGEVSDKIQSDEILLMIGCRYFKSLHKKRDKKLETTKYVRGRLRLSARIYIEFEKQMKLQNIFLDDACQNSSDLFRRETITILGE